MTWNLIEEVDNRLYGALRTPRVQHHTDDEKTLIKTFRSAVPVLSLSLELSHNRIEFFQTHSASQL